MNETIVETVNRIAGNSHILEVQIVELAFIVGLAFNLMAAFLRKSPLWRNDRHLVAEPLDALDRLMKDSVPRSLLEVVRAQVFIGGAVSDEVVDDGQDAVSYSNGGSFTAAPGSDSSILR